MAQPSALCSRCGGVPLAESCSYCDEGKVFYDGNFGSPTGHRICSVLIMGARAVGKSAVMIRLVTGNFIGDDYDPTISEDPMYTMTVPYSWKGKIQNPPCPRFKLVDSIPWLQFVRPTNDDDEDFRWSHETEIKAADAFVIVCSVSDKLSVTIVDDIMERIHTIRKSLSEAAFVPPVVLLANKVDLMFEQQPGYLYHFNDGVSDVANNLCQQSRTNDLCVDKSVPLTYKKTDNHLTLHDINNIARKWDIPVYYTSMKRNIVHNADRFAEIVQKASVGRKSFALLRLRLLALGLPYTASDRWIQCSLIYPDSMTDHPNPMILTGIKKPFQKLMHMLWDSEPSNQGGYCNVM